MKNLVEKKIAKISCKLIIWIINVMNNKLL